MNYLNRIGVLLDLDQVGFRGMAFDFQHQADQLRAAILKDFVEFLDRNWRMGLEAKDQGWRDGWNDAIDSMVRARHAYEKYGDDQ